MMDNSRFNQIVVIFIRAVSISSDLFGKMITLDQHKDDQLYTLSNDSFLKCVTAVMDIFHLTKQSEFYLLSSQKKKENTLQNPEGIVNSVNAEFKT